YPGREVDLQVPATLAVGVEEQDFDEMVGNLLENAFKWSAGRLRISSAELGGWITLRIEDDGPGMSEDQIAKAVLRGVRLDEKVPGSGLGLNIVSDLAEAYRGSLIMGRAELGGLAASLSLPKVARVES
ncbi:TPA: sensor histidine kinase, partial [Aeromonas hydrophila]|nr:sensor histidine kinase [Aeromonas hydrophila]